VDAQLSQKQGPRNLFHCNPVVFFAAGWFHLAYARVLTDHISVQIEPGVIVPFEGDGLGLTVDVRPVFHFLRPAPAGLYLSPFVRVWYSTHPDWIGYDLTILPGAAIGWSWVFGPMTARIGAGFQVPIEVAEHQQQRSGWFSGFDLDLPVLPHVEGAIGVAF
jgi:hypothetical protein